MASGNVRDCARWRLTGASDVVSYTIHHPDRRHSRSPSRASTILNADCSRTSRRQFPLLLAGLESLKPRSISCITRADSAWIIGRKVEGALAKSEREHGDVLNRAVCFDGQAGRQVGLRITAIISLLPSIRFSASCTGSPIQRVIQDYDSYYDPSKTPSRQWQDHQTDDRGRSTSVGISDGTRQQDRHAIATLSST